MDRQLKGISLADVAFACYVYGPMTGYDTSLHELQDRLGEDPDLRDKDQCLRMLSWLNHWGCRHLATAYHPLAADELSAWFEMVHDTLPDPKDRLVALSPGALAQVSSLFDGLSRRRAALKKHGDTTISVSFGPTAAAKTLFALRPHIFVAWDAPMRAAMKHGGSGSSYVDFLAGVRQILLDLAEQCAKHGLALEDLPRLLGRPRSSVAQLIDEYYWITVTREVRPPDAAILERWLLWSFGNRS